MSDRDVSRAKVQRVFARFYLRELEDAGYSHEEARDRWNSARRAMGRSKREGASEDPDGGKDGE